MNLSTLPIPRIVALMMMSLVGATSAGDDSARGAVDQREGRAPPSEKSLSWARRHLQDQVAREYLSTTSYFQGKTTNTTKYLKAQGYKSGAVCVDWGQIPQLSRRRVALGTVDENGAGFSVIKARGFAAAASTPKEAEQAALKACNLNKNNSARKYDCNCATLYTENGVVLEVPTRTAAIVANWLDSLEFPALCASWIEHKPIGFFVRPPNKPSFGVDKKATACSADLQTMRSGDFVVNDVVSAIERDKTSTPPGSPDVFPGPPVVDEHKLRDLDLRDDYGNQVSKYIWFYPPVGDVWAKAWSTEYTLPDKWGYHYKLFRVPDEARLAVTNTLKAIETSKLYRRIKRQMNPEVPLPNFDAKDRLANYVRAFDVTDPKTASAFNLQPAYWKGGLLGVERPITLWAEASVLVDAVGIPVSAPLRSVRPIAILSNRALYLYAEEIVREQPDESAGGVSEPFEGRVLNLSRCHPHTGCVAFAVDYLAAEVVAELSGEPIAAKLASPTVPRKGSARLQRTFEESRVLSGLAGPYYELSTYTVTAWAAPNFVPLATVHFRDRAAGKDSWGPDDQIYLTVSHALQISVGRNGTYTEPTAAQYRAYNDEVQRAVARALSRVTERLRAFTTVTD
ncbi:hypothetical protein [Roseateles sp. LYH14W]|uniref:DUF4136 domain-containing protein n=1 Tax=Pelomonas parva TaxID=3299032 RepID=A0ABW7FA87_9BURK